MREVLAHARPGIDQSDVLERLGLTSGSYFIVSVHREENVDSPDNLRRVVACLEGLHAEYQLPVVVSTHPRTRSRLNKLGLGNDSDAIRFLKPFGFHDYNRLQVDAFCAVSDSGTISEESAILGFPAVTLRNSLERPEALDAGSIILTGLDPTVLQASVRLARQRFATDAEREIPAEYQVSNTAERVVKLILGTAGLASRWRNLDNFSRYDWH